MLGSVLQGSRYILYATLAGTNMIQTHVMVLEVVVVWECESWGLTHLLRLHPAD